MVWDNSNRPSRPHTARHTGHRSGHHTGHHRASKGGHKGHPLSATTRAKISAALRGKPHPHRGHPISAETRAKISAALKGRTRGGRHRKHGKRHYIPHPRVRHPRKPGHHGHRRASPHPRVRHPRTHHSAIHRGSHPRTHRSGTRLPRTHRSSHSHSTLPRKRAGTHHTGRKHPHTGHHLTDATKRKISSSHLGKAHPHKGTHHPGIKHSTRHPGTSHHGNHRLPGNVQKHQGVRHHHHSRRHQKHRTTPTGKFHPGGRHGRFATPKPHRHTRRSQISSATHHHYLGYVHTKTRHKRTKISVRRTSLVRAHRVWRRSSTRSRRRRL